MFDAKYLRDNPEQARERLASRGDEVDLAPFVELLIAVRAQLRAARQWVLADEIRQRLSKLGIILEDGPTETTWRRD